MVTQPELIQYIDELLQPQLFKDYAPNGLQVGGRHEIRSIVTGVTASLALIDTAIANKADAILVHHGYFWRGEDPCIVGMKRERLTKLLQHDINMIGYHLPLDAHTVYGNNAQLAHVLGIPVTDRFETHDGAKLGFLSHFEQPRDANELQAHITDCLQREPLYITGSDQPIERLAWCTGGAQDVIEIAHQVGADAFLTGEVSERTTHFAREMGMHFFAAGHHATERYGVKALGEHLAEHFGIAHHFIDIDNPV